MKCEIVGSLLNNPRLLLLDEPTLGLDIITKKKILSGLKKINKDQKTTILFTSHNLKDVSEICNHLLVLNKGKLIYDDTVESIINKHFNISKLIIKGIDPNTSDELLKKHLKIYNRDIIKIELNYDDLILYINEKDKLLSLRILENITKITDFESYNIERISFEEIIESLYEER